MCVSVHVWVLYSVYLCECVWLLSDAKCLARKQTDIQQEQRANVWKCIKSISEKKYENSIQIKFHKNCCQMNLQILLTNSILRALATKLIPIYQELYLHKF